MKTTACNIKVDDEYDVYCGRGFGLKNDPLKCEIGEHGWLGNPIAKNNLCLFCKKFHDRAGDTLPCYKKYLLNRLEDKDFKGAFIQLKGQKLGCFCKPGPCHTDVIIEVLETLTENL